MGDTGLLGRRRYLPEQAKHAGYRIRILYYASASLDYTLCISYYEPKLTGRIHNCLGSDRIFLQSLCPLQSLEIDQRGPMRKGGASQEIGFPTDRRAFGSSLYL
jgi:hypothetical protein